MRLLVVHPDDRAAGRLRLALTAFGHVVDVCLEPLAAGAVAASATYDLVVLKDDRPRHPAADTLKALGDRSGAKVLAFGPDAGPDDRARLLRAGADECLVEPFALAEMLARIDALCRRRPHRFAFEPRIVVGDLDLDMVRRQATRQGRALHLTVQEFTLLAALARHAGRVLERNELRECLWGQASDSDSNRVDVAVRRLRVKLDRDFRARLIHTVRGAGYVLVEHDGAPEADPP